MFVLAGGAVLAVLLWWFLPLDRLTIETWYSRGAYRRIAAILVPLTDLAPFSLSVWGSAVGAAGCLVLWWRAWRRGRRRGVRWYALRWGALRCTLLALVVYVLFVALWGAGYRRVPLADRLGLDEASVSDDEWRDCASGLLGVIAATETAPRDVDVALASFRASLAATIATWDGVPVTLPARIKSPPRGSLLTFGSAGVTSPFTLEAHVDRALPDAAFVRVAAHELAHVAGLCGEAEADLAAALSGLKAEHAFVRYAIALDLFRSVVRRLPATEQSAWVERLPERARADLRAERDAYLRYRSDALSKVQSRVYDTYLRSQGVEDGLANYALAADLFALSRRRGLVEFATPAAEKGAGE